MQSVAESRRRACLIALCFLIGAVVLVGCAGSGPGLGESGDSHLPLQAFVATRLDSAGHAEAQVRVETTHRALVFTRGDAGFHSELVVLVTARRGDDQVGGGVGQTTVDVMSYEATRSSDAVIVDVPLVVRGGDDVVLAVTASVRQTQRRWQRRLAFSPHALAAMPLAVQHVRMSPPAGAAGTHVVTADDDTVRLAVGLRRTSEPWPQSGVRLVATLTASGLTEPRSVVRDIAPPAAARDSVATDLEFPATQLPFGRVSIELSLDLLRDGHRQSLPYGRPLALEVLRVPVDDDHAWRRHVGWLKGLLPDAVQDSLRALPAAQRQAAWTAAWQRIAASRSEDPQTAALDHLRRIVTADERFGQFGRGALSDRGRAIIRYGEPGHVERYLDNLSGTGVWEIWEYPDLGLRLLFFDAHGMGDFQLSDVQHV